MVCFIANSQELQRTIDAGDYYTQDTTTLAFTVPPDINLVLIDFTDLDTSNAVLTVGAVSRDSEIFVAHDITGNPFTLDNDTTTYQTITNFGGVAEIKHVIAIAVDGDKWIGTKLGFNFNWNDVTDGDIRIYW